MKKLISFVCFICMIVSCLAPLSAQAATDWREGKYWTGSGASYKNGIVYLGDNASYSSAYYGSADSYTMRMTVRVTQFSSSNSMGIQLYNGSNRAGIYMRANGISPFGGTAVKFTLDSNWHDWKIMVKNGMQSIYMDGKHLTTCPTNPNTGRPSVKFWITGTGKMEVENFTLVADKVEGEHDGSLLTAPLETEYADEFTVDWSDPESYKDWTITPSDNIKINAETGILTFDIPKGDTGYYQVERSPLMPDNFDVDFRLQLEEIGGRTFQFKATHPGHNNYQTLNLKYIGMSSAKYNNYHGDGTLVDIGTDWHEWKMEVRGAYVTIYMDGGELCRFEQAKSSQQSIIRFMMNGTEVDEYKIHLDSVHYKPYFPKADMKSPANGSEFLEGSDIVFQATVAENVEYVDYFVNGLKVGRGYAPTYEYKLKNAKAGAYRVSAGINGESSGVESVITVRPGIDADIKSEKQTINYGETANVFIDWKNLEMSEGVAPTKVTYYVDGMEYAVSRNEVNPFLVNIAGLPVGTSTVHATIENANGAIYKTKDYNIDVVSAGNEAVTLDREYELDYDTTASEGKVLVNDGYFSLDINHKDGKLVAKSKDGEHTANLGVGKYKVVVTSGIADLYYNGHFATSWMMPRDNAAQEVKHSGLASFEIGGTGVKTTMFSEKWTGDANYHARLTKRDPNYSIEFDKLDASDEHFVFYDGEYAIDLDVKDGKIHSYMHIIDTGEVRPIVLEGEAKAGYWRINVAKGLGQVYIDNEFQGSFVAEENFRGPEIFRTMTNPSASTFIAVKNTDDMYYYVDDFSGNKEMDSIDYWFADTEKVSASVQNEALLIEGSGDMYLNANSDDVWMKWSAKVDGTNTFYITPRVFREPRVNVKAGYDFKEKKWFLSQFAKDYNYQNFNTKEYFEGPALTTGQWHDFEIELVDEHLVLKMDGQTVIDTTSIITFYWGFVGFGIDGGTAEIDNIDYRGHGKPTAGINSMINSSTIGLAEMFQKSDGTVVIYNNNTYETHTDDHGKTWSPIAKNSYGYMTGVENLNDGKLIRFERVNGGSEYLAQISSDDGATWETMGGFDTARPAWRRVVRNGTVNQMSNGRIFVHTDESFTEYNCIAGLYYSDDLGKTWKESSMAFGGVKAEDGYTTETTGQNFQEGMFEELPDGTIRFFARNGFGYLAYMDSHDGGETFGEMRPYQLTHSLTSYMVRRDPDNPNTYYAITSYDANTYSYRTPHSPRNRLALFASYDGMKTWEFAMDLVESGDIGVWDSCNHVLKIFDGTIYVNWNNLNGSRLSYLFAIDASKLRTSKRLAEIHEREFVGMFGKSNFDKHSVLPKTSGDGYIYGNLVDITVANGMYDAKTVAQVFGAEYTASGNTVTFKLGDGTVVFTEGSNSYTVNGEAKPFAENCMNGGYLNIKACAEAFGKSITESDTSYILWYNEPYTQQYLEDLVNCA